MSSPLETPLQSPEFKDQSTGLVIFGILTALIGLLFALFVPLMFVGQSMSAKSGMIQDIRAIMAPVAIYGLLAVVFIWLGIGSMLARRWARALLLIVSWSWLVTGILSVGMMAVMAPHFSETLRASAPPGQPQLPASTQTFVFLMIGCVLGVGFLLLPAAWVLFYRSRNVKATCEVRDPAIRWTDRCPLPVLGISLWFAFTAPMMLLMVAFGHGVAPMFGTFVSGPAGSAIYVALALVWGYTAWACYKLDRRGWWIAVSSICLFSVSSLLTYSRHDVTELYALMGYPKETIAQIQKFNFMQGHVMAWSSLCGAVPYLGFLFYVRRFFGQSQTSA